MSSKNVLPASAAKNRKPEIGKFIKTVSGAAKKNPKAVHTIGGQAGVKKTDKSKQVKVLPR